MAASKQASKHTHACAQCSHASVGLAQARPNYPTRALTHCVYTMQWKVKDCEDAAHKCKNPKNKSLMGPLKIWRPQGSISHPLGGPDVTFEKYAPDYLPAAMSRISYS